LPPLLPPLPALALPLLLVVVVRNGGSGRQWRGCCVGVVVAGGCGVGVAGWQRVTGRGQQESGNGQRRGGER